METTEDNAAQRLRMMLTEYAVELVNETPVLSRYTDVFSRSDGLGGYAETERDRAWRNDLKYPHTVTDLESCITGLTQFKDAPTAWDNLRGELLKTDYDWLAKELAYRRERRNANLDRMISAAKALAPVMPTVEEILSAMTAEDEKPQDDPKYDIATALQRAENGTLYTPPTLPRETSDRRTGNLDFRDWEYAATKFDDDTTGDIAYIEETVANIAEKTTVTQPPPAIATVELVPEQAALLAKAADHSAAERAAAGIDEIKGKMLALWRRWLYGEPYKPERTREIPPAEQKLCAAMNKALFAYWKAFQNGELDGTLSVQEHDKYIVGRTHKRSAAEFLETHGKDVVWTAHGGKQYTLQELCPTVEDVQRMIDKNNKAIKRARQKNGQSADKKKI